MRWMDGDSVAVREKVVIPVKPEAGETPMIFYPVMTINSNDPAFVKMLEDAQRIKDAEAIAAGNARIAADVEFAAGDMGADPNAITLFPDVSITPVYEWFSSVATGISEGARAAAERNDKANANVFNKGK